VMDSAQLLLSQRADALTATPESKSLCRCK
jgi:hypothetical protein